MKKNVFYILYLFAHNTFVASTLLNVIHEMLYTNMHDPLTVIFYEKCICINAYTYSEVFSFLLIFLEYRLITNLTNM